MGRDMGKVLWSMLMAEYTKENGLKIKDRDVGMKLILMETFIQERSQMVSFWLLFGRES